MNCNSTNAITASESTGVHVDVNSLELEDIPINSPKHQLNNRNSFSIFNNTAIDTTPVEFQREEYKIDDPYMDPLEWTVKKIVPIPKAYYWTIPEKNDPSSSAEDMSHSNELDNDGEGQTPRQSIPMKIKVWHNSICALAFAFHCAEKTGEFFANIMGLTKSRYDYVTSTMTEDEWELAKENADKKKEDRLEYMQQQKT